MKQRLCLIGALCVAACSDDPPGALKSGTLAGGISQLRYESDTQSGMTDASGIFSYREGENVTFFVGGTKLGTATGAETLTIFDLFGATPATDGVIVLQQLDEQSSTVRPLFRAVNAWTFLLGLDIDGIPTNGIDLTGRDAQLAKVHVGFDHNPADFDAQLRIAARVPGYGIRYNGLDATFSSLYSAHGLTVSGDAITATTTSAFGMSATFSFTYNASSQATSAAVSQGAVVGATAALVYDEGLRLQSLTFDTAADGMGGLASRSVAAYTYSPVGVYQGATFSRHEGVAAPEVISAASLSYDGSGRLTAIADTSFAFVRSTFAFDESADAVTVLYEYRATEDGPVTNRTRTRYAYDADGNTVTETYASDYPPTGVYTSTTTTTSTFDARGYAMTRTNVTTDAAGVVTSRGEQAYTYEGSYLVKDVYRAQTADGATTGTSTVTFQYDGDLLTRRTATTEPAGGIATVTSDVAVTHDASGHVLVSDAKYFDGGGALTDNDIETFTYDARGNVATSSRTSLSGGFVPMSSFTYAPTSNGIVAGLQQERILRSGL